MALSRINTNQIVDGAVATADIADGLITTAKLADGAVTTAKVADDAVTNAKVADNAVANSQLADNAVGTSEIADDAVTTAKVNPAQTDITSVGTLTALNVSGDIELDGGDFVFNNSGASKDFRIEGDTFSNLFICDGSEDDIGMGLTPSFTSGNGVHLADDFKIGFGAGGNSRPDFQLGYTSSTDRLSLACGFGADTADIQITTGGFVGVGIGGGTIDRNFMVKDSHPRMMFEETSSGGSKRMEIGVKTDGTPFLSAEQSGGIIDVFLTGSHMARFYQFGLIVQNQTTSGIFQLKANVSSGVGTPQLEMYRSNVFQGGLEAGVNANANGGGNNMVIKAPQGEVYAIDSSGNSSNISPHNFDYIPDGASESGAWCFKSDKLEKEILEQDETKKVIKEKVKSGTFISADMTKVIRQVEKLTGEKLIYKGTLDVDEEGIVKKHIDDGSTVKDNIIADLIKRIEALEKA